MAKTIVWTQRAVNKFHAIEEYIEDEWGALVAEKFANQTYGIIETLAEFPELGTVENEKLGIRGFTLTKQNTLFYRDTYHKLIILNFFDNRQNPDNKKY